LSGPVVIQGAAGEGSTKNKNMVSAATADLSENNLA
jgi:hypothetical protein